MAFRTRDQRLLMRWVALLAGVLIGTLLAAYLSLVVELDRVGRVAGQAATMPSASRRGLTRRDRC